MSKPGLVVSIVRIFRGRHLGLLRLPGLLLLRLRLPLHPDGEGAGGAALPQPGGGARVALQGEPEDEGAGARRRVPRGRHCGHSQRDGEHFYHNFFGGKAQGKRGKNLEGEERKWKEYKNTERG